MLLHLQNVILQAFHHIDNLHELKQIDSTWYLKEYSNKLESAINGFENLKKTYENDATLVSKIEIIMSHIQKYIIKINKIISNNKDE